MGQAKARGTFEQRKEQAEKNYEKYVAERALKQKESKMPSSAKGMIQYLASVSGNSSYSTKKAMKKLHKADKLAGK